MYSYEERVRAVELYLKLGKRIKATIRQLGYGCTQVVARVRAGRGAWDWSIAGCWLRRGSGHYWCGTQWIAPD